MRAQGRTVWAAALVGAVACTDAPAVSTGGATEVGGEVIAAAASSSEPAPQTLDIKQLGMDRGAEGAPVRIIEFSDYGCGACRKFHEETWPVLLREFIDAGKVEWKFLPYVSGMFGNTSAATTAAECVLEQGDTLFYSMNGRIWGQQNEWKRSDDAASVLRRLAHESGAEMLRYDACLSQGRRAHRIEGSNALARQVGVRATPTFFVVGYPPIQGALPTETFVQVLNLVYEESTRAPGPP